MRGVSLRAAGLAGREGRPGRPGGGCWQGVAAVTEIGSGWLLAGLHGIGFMVFFCRGRGDLWLLKNLYGIFMWSWLFTDGQALAGLSAPHCSSTSAPPPPSPKSLHRTRESAGERGGARRFLPRAGVAAGGAWGRPRGAAGGREGPESPADAAPGFPRRPLGRRVGQFSLPLRPASSLGDLSVLLNGSSWSSPLPCPCGNLTPLALRAPGTPLLPAYLTLTLALSNAPGSCTGGDGSRVPGEKTPGCVGVRMGAGTPSSIVPGKPLFYLVKWGRYQPTNPGRMRPQSEPTSIPNYGGQDTQQSRDRRGLGAEWA